MSKWELGEATPEVDKLLAGETITITYTSKKDGKPAPATGKLEWQDYQGRKFLGFKADFGSKKGSGKGGKK